MDVRCQAIYNEKTGMAQCFQYWESSQQDTEGGLNSAGYILVTDGSVRLIAYPKWIVSNEPQLKSYTRMKRVLLKGRLLFDWLPICWFLEQIDRFFL